MATPLLKKMMKGPKCWKGYVAKGKKKSPSGKKILMEAQKWLITVLK